MTTDTQEPGKKLLSCPYCDWTSRLFDPDCDAARLAREVDAEMHFENEHPNVELPPDYEYGDYQCPSCYRMDGMEGRVSCKHCGFIPEDKRLSAKA